VATASDTLSSHGHAAALVARAAHVPKGEAFYGASDVAKEDKVKGKSRSKAKVKPLEVR
jgi:hypothetical protein